MPISTPTKLIEVLYGLGFGKQTDIGTANLAAAMWSLKKLNASLLTDQPTVKDNRDEYGKGHEYATQTYLEGFTQSQSVEYYLSSEKAAWLFAMGLGKVSMTGSSAPYTYTCTPLNPANGDSSEPPYFTWCEQARPGSNVVIDRAVPGMAIEEFNLTFQAGPGIDASKHTASFIGSGRMTEPSAITLPSVLAEHLLPANTLAFTVNSVDYVATKKWRTLTFGWKNNLALQYDAGSGFRTSGDPTSGVLASRILLGSRVPTMSFTALYQNGSAEYAALRGQGTSTATFSLTRDSENSLTVTLQKVSFATTVLEQAGEFIVARVDLLPQYDATNGLISAVIKTGVTGIGA